MNDALERLVTEFLSDLPQEPREGFAEPDVQHTRGMIGIGNRTDGGSAPLLIQADIDLGRLK